MVSFIALFSFKMLFTWVASVGTVSLSSLFSTCKVSICDWVYSILVLLCLCSVFPGFRVYYLWILAHQP